MNLRKFIHPETLLTGVKVSGVEDLLRQQAESIYGTLPEHLQIAHPLHQLVEMLMERERKQSTGLGEGILVPHARVSNFNHLGLSIAVLAEEMTYETMDGKPVQLSCMVIAPAETPNIVIKIWSTLAKLLSDPAVHQYFLQATDARTLYEYLNSRELNLDLSVTAADIMIPPRTMLREDTSLQEATFQMFKFKEPCLGVVDTEGRLVGQITSDDVFEYGMPAFFTQLQSVSFVRNFNPLEKYFQNESQMRVADILNRDFAAVLPGATLIEVIFQLTVKKRLKVFVVSPEGKLLGIIDRLAVLDRAINF